MPRYRVNLHAVFETEFEAPDDKTARQIADCFDVKRAELKGSGWSTMTRLGGLVDHDDNQHHHDP